MLKFVNSQQLIDDFQSCNQGLVILDTREFDTFRICHIKDSIHVPLGARCCKRGSSPDKSRYISAFIGKDKLHSCNKIIVIKGSDHNPYFDSFYCSLQSIVANDNTAANDNTVVVSNNTSPVVSDDYTTAISDSTSPVVSDDDTTAISDSTGTEDNAVVDDNGSSSSSKLWLLSSAQLAELPEELLYRGETYSLQDQLQHLALGISAPGSQLCSLNRAVSRLSVGAESGKFSVGGELGKLSLQAKSCHFSSQAGLGKISQINEHLYLAGSDSFNLATIRTELQQLGIDACINCADECPNPAGIDLPCLRLNLSDNGNVCLTDELLITVLDYIGRYNKVLIFCYAGISRSVAVIISIIMYQCKRSYHTVLEQVRQIRPQVDPGLPFVNFLLHWQELHGLATPSPVIVA